MNAPKIDQRTYRELVAETAALASYYTAYAEPTAAALTGRRLRQALVIPSQPPRTLPAGQVITPELAELISAIPAIGLVPVQGWQAGDGARDAGGALIRIFARYAELLIDRINRAPEKNFLAFLNLIGMELLPPQPARVPLTFQLAENSPVDAAVPAGTEVASPPLNGEEDEVVFATERSLIVTRAQLQALFVRDTANDRYSDRTAEATGQIDRPFAAFTGDRPTLHQLYLACDELLTLPGPKDLTLTIHSPHHWQWQHWPITWSYWDGVDWRTVEPTGEPANGVWPLSFRQLPPLPPHPIHEIEAGWLRAQLDLPLPSGQTGHLPAAIAVGSRNPQSFTGPFDPFGASEQVRFFYLSASETFACGGARIQILVTLAQKGVADELPLKVSWSYKGKVKANHEGSDEGNDWIALGLSSTAAERVGDSRFELVDGTRAFTRTGVISFYVPFRWPVEFHRTLTGRWLRVAIDDGHYSTLPQIESISLTYDWELPRIRAVSARLDTTPSPLPSDLAFLNGSALDVSKDFYPVGEQPRFNDTFYLALPAALARPGRRVKLQVTLTNPAGASAAPVKPVYSDGKPQLAWEFWNGSAWQPASGVTASAIGVDGKPAPDDGPKNLIRSGDLMLTLPDPLIPTAVNGEERLWLRARLVSGHYGEPASYQPTVDATKNITGYHFVEATLAPPLIQKLAFVPVDVESKEVALSACLSYNDFEYAVHRPPAQPAAPEPDAFAPFAATADSEPALYLGFDRPFDPRPVTLYLQVEPPLPEEVAADRMAAIDPTSSPHVAWEYEDRGGWQPLAALDETQMLAKRGLVDFVGPRNFVAAPRFGETRYWLRARWQRGEFPLPPRLRRVLANTTWAAQMIRVEDEILGSGNGDPNQRFFTVQSPVQPGQALVVREPELPPATEQMALRALEGPDAITLTVDAAGQPDEIWVRWHAVADFYESGARDRHYMLDALTGEVRFGDGAAGLIPPPGQNNIRISYRSGGGAAGNRPPNTVVELKSSLPYVDSVTNHEAAQGGAEREPIERLKERGPRGLRHRERALTAQDLEDLALAASPEVARAAAIVPTFQPYSLWLNDPQKDNLAQHLAVDAGRMGVIVVPNATVARPTPSLGLLRHVQAHLQARCPATADLWVAGPEWVAVTVKATVVPLSLAVADAVGGRVREALARFLHPLTGGAQGQGWDFGRNPHPSDLFALIEAVAGVDHVRTLEVTLAPESANQEQSRALQTLLQRPLRERTDPTERERDLHRWLKRALVYSGDHLITTVLTEM